MLTQFVHVLACSLDRYLLSISHGLDQQCGAKSSGLRDSYVCLTGFSQTLTLYYSPFAMCQPHSLQFSGEHPPLPILGACQSLCLEHPSSTRVLPSAPHTLCQVNSFSSCRTQSDATQSRSSLIKQSQHPMLLLHATSPSNTLGKCKALLCVLCMLFTLHITPMKSVL